MRMALSPPAEIRKKRSLVDERYFATEEASAADLIGTTGTCTVGAGSGGFACETGTGTDCGGVGRCGTTGVTGGTSAGGACFGTACRFGRASRRGVGCTLAFRSKPCSVSVAVSVPANGSHNRIVRSQ